MKTCLQMSARKGKTLQDRGYVSKEAGTLRPTPRGRTLSAYLVSFFPQYLDMGFTCNMEDQLDQISSAGLLCVWHAGIYKLLCKQAWRVAGALGLESRAAVCPSAVWFAHGRGRTRLACSAAAILGTISGTYNSCTGRAYKRHH